MVFPKHTICSFRQLPLLLECK